MLVTSARSRRRQAGFTLIELLVTLVIVTVGLLGVAKMQAAAVAETTVARTRSLMTFQAEALASAMRSNKAFWQPAAFFNMTVPIAAGGIPAYPAALVAPVTADGTCVSPAAATPCTAAQLAYDDIHTWSNSFGQRFPPRPARSSAQAPPARPRPATSR